MDWKTEMNIPEKDCRIQEDYNDSDCNDNAVDGSGNGSGWDNYVEEDERDRMIRTTTANAFTSSNRTEFGK